MGLLSCYVVCNPVLPYSNRQYAIRLPLDARRRNRSRALIAKRSNGTSKLNSTESPIKPIPRWTSVDLTHWGRVTYICVGEVTIIVSDIGLSPGRRQAIIWTNAGILVIGPYGTNFSEILIEIITFSLKKMHLKMSSGKCRPFCLGLNVLV